MAFPPLVSSEIPGIVSHPDKASSPYLHLSRSELQESGSSSRPYHIPRENAMVPSSFL